MINDESVGSIVFFGNQLLLLKYKTIKGDEEYWDFPKGHPNKNERKEDALLREVMEETGLKVSILRGFKDEVTYFFRQKGDLVKKTVVFFVSIAKSKDVKISSEHYGFRWLTPKEALMVIKHPSSKKILEAAAEFYDAQPRLEKFV